MSNTGVSAANIKLGADITGLLNGLKAASQAIGSHVYTINTQLTTAYKQADTAARTFRGGLTRLGSDLQGIAKQMTIIGALPAIISSAKAYKDYSELQKLEKGLVRYGESLEEVRELAKLPNIGIFDGAKSLIALKAMRMESDLAKRSIKAFANAITDAGGSSIDLEPALINLRQFKSTQHINQVDLRQLANRIPQTMEAIQNAFGTTDVEKLNKLGIDKFIEGFITELEKIKPVSGGAATAMEQLGDSFTFFSGTLGEGIDKAFGITEAISKLGGALDGLSTTFRGLTPEAQKSILALGAVAIAMPAIVGAVGGLIKILPLLATGFGLISGPIAATIAVVGLAAAAIVANWDSVKKFLTDSTWWNTIVGIAKSTLGVVVEVFKVVINLIQGDWGNLGKALVNILKNASNLIVNVLAGTIKGVLGMFGSFNEAIGFSSLAKGISSAVNWIDELAKKLQFDVPDSFAGISDAIKSIKKDTDTTTSGTKDLNKAASDAADSIKQMSAAEREMQSIDLSMKWQKEQDALKAKIKEYKELFGVVSTLNVEFLKANGISSGIGLNAFSSDSENQKFQSALAGDKATNTFTGLGAKISPPAGLKETTKAYSDTVNEIEYLNRELTASIVDLKSGLGIAVGEGLGDVLSGLEGGMKGVGKNILAVFADVLSQLGKAMLTWAATVATAKIALKSLNPVIAAAAGIAAVIAGKALKNSIAKTSATARFAKGALVYGEMNAVVGDNPNAHVDPEVISPLSKLQDMIKKSVKEIGGGGSNVFIGDVTIRGEDLRIAFNRAEQSNRALKGR